MCNMLLRPEQVHPLHDLSYISVGLGLSNAIYNIIVIKAGSGPTRESIFMTWLTKKLFAPLTQRDVLWAPVTLFGKHGHVTRLRVSVVGIRVNLVN